MIIVVEWMDMYTHWPRCYFIICTPACSCSYPISQSDIPVQCIQSWASVNVHIKHRTGKMWCQCFDLDLILIISDFEHFRPHPDPLLSIKNYSLQWEQVRQKVKIGKTLPGWMNLNVCCNIVRNCCQQICSTYLTFISQLSELSAKRCPTQY